MKERGVRSVTKVMAAHSIGLEKALEITWFSGKNKGTKRVQHRLIRVGASYKLVLHLPKAAVRQPRVSGSLGSAGEESAKRNRQVGKGFWT